MPMDLPSAVTHSLRCSGKRRDAWVVAPNYTGRGTERALRGSSNVDSCTCPVASSFMFLVRAATVSRVFRDGAGMILLKLEDHHSVQCFTKFRGKNRVLSNASHLEGSG